jgi:acyl-coenzyme A synthetase/AMP-(fatty) acid ligase/peptidoglycan/LPS O-acetylase OafA/YrhL
MPMRGSSTVAGVPLVHALGTHGDRLAVVDADGTPTTYRHLAGRVTAAAEELGPVRRLVLVEAANTVDAIVGHLAALHGGHPVLLADRRGLDTLVDAYDPDVVWAGGQVRERRAGSAHDLHEDLALLLSTSGSTGSPKLVRLSARNIEANARSIAQYLDIRDSDRAMASLPLHYCYGLSVVHSNLLRGAALVLTDRSVADPGFWTAFHRRGATSLHGVPYTFDLLDRAGFADLDLPTLRYVTQAGGRLAPERVRRFAELGERAGWRFYVMYGQTEATARMAYLPPALARAHPATVGIPVPGGSFQVDRDGELVYRGPNVMLGYAHGPADLALGRTVDALRTGDIGRRTPEGLYEIVGRAGRFVKLFGLRVDLDGVERILAAEAVEAACAGTDTGLVVAARGEAERARSIVTAAVGLPSHAVRVHPVAEIPRLPTGKPDHAAVARLAAPPRARARSARDIVAAAVGGPGVEAAIDRGATFSDLGGDSLSYVAVAVELEKRLGRVPDDWPTRPVRDLERIGPAAGSRSRIETGIALRALAVVLVVGSHVGLFTVLGGAHLLLVLAGWSFARFVLPAGTAPAARRIVRCLARVAVPCVAWIGWRAAVEEDVDAVNILMINYVLDPAAWGYWFVEVLVQVLAVLAALFAIPAVTRAQARHPFGFAAVALAVALAAAVAARTFLDPGNEFADRFLATDLVAWLFVLGWLAQRARTPGHRLVVGATTVLLLPGFFGDPHREAVVVGGLLLALFCPRVPVPRAAAGPVALVASASLYIYLTHYAVQPALEGSLPDAAVVAACVAAGVAGWLGVEGIRRRVAAWRAAHVAGKNLASPVTPTSTRCPAANPPEAAVRLRTV